MALNSFKELHVWQRSMDLVDLVYDDVTARLPITERYALADQLRRAAVSIPSNIAEGSKRGTRADFRQFCRIALGSAAEVETQLLIVQRRYSHIQTDRSLNEVLDIQKMLTKLVASLANPLSTMNNKR